MLKVNVKWGKQKYAVDLNTNEPPIVFKSQLFAITGVPPDRQKITGVKGGMLKDDADWSTTGVKDGHNFMMIGSADELAKAPEKAIVFMEDLTQDQADALSHAIYPPGLSNLGNTCYMNSTLQCFRAVPELRSALKVYTGSASDNDNAVSVTAALRDLYGQMEASNKPAHPLLFLMVLRRAFPQFAQQGQGGIFMQQDAEECWSQLMSTLSRKIPRVPGQATATAPEGSQGMLAESQNAVSDLFSGELVSSLKCLETEETPTIKTDTFVKLVCHINAQVSFLLPGLKEGLEEPLSKNNPSLNREAKYLRTSRISRLPYYLTVQFMRFEWRSDTKQKAKIVRPVEFPFVLDVYDLCSSDLQKDLVPKRRELEAAEEKKMQKERERMKRKAEDDGEKEKATEVVPMEQDKPAESSTSSTASTSTQKDNTITLTNQTGKYELVAVLTHKGRTADSGHYIGWVKQSDDQWLKFDDDQVSVATNDDIVKLNGKGGADWNIAYMCLYRTYNPVL